MGNSKGIVKRIRIETIDAAKIELLLLSLKFCKDGDAMKKIRKIKINGKSTDYKADIDGNIWSYKNKKKPFILKPMINKFGYLVVNLHIDKKQKQFRINRLVAGTFIPNPNNYPQVNHKDGDKTNNHVWNLEWVTAKENTNHAIKTGLRVNSGEEFHSSKLSNKDVHKICKLLEENKLKATEIPELIGPHCTIKMVQNILYNNTWPIISKNYDLSKHTIEENHGKSKLTKEKVHEICKLLETTTLSYQKISDIVGGCTKHDVNHIKNGYTWTSISKEYDFSIRDK